MRLYAAAGHAYLVCPGLLEIDPRHARHWSRHPQCAQGSECIQDHEHEPALASGGGHRVADFYWRPGSDHIQTHLDCTDGCHDDLRCPCGQQLAFADLDDPHVAAVLADEQVVAGDDDQAAGSQPESPEHDPPLLRLEPAHDDDRQHRQEQLARVELERPQLEQAGAERVELQGVAAAERDRCREVVGQDGEQQEGDRPRHLSE